MANQPTSASAPTDVERAQYLVFGRLIPGVLYTIFGVILLRQVISSYSLGSSPSIFRIAAGPVRETLYFAFVVMPIGIYITRPMPRARDGSVPAWVAALLGTTILLLVGIFAPAGPLLFTIPHWLVDAADLTIALATALSVSGLAMLRHSFSIVPEARRVVRGGPYRFVRHPLYVGEILVALATLLVGTTVASGSEFGPHLVASLAFVIFVGLQLVRIGFEERLLARTFPDYEDYCRHTARLVPFIW